MTQIQTQNLRPYFKFTLPTLDILPAEKDIWGQAAGESIEPGQVREGGWRIEDMFILTSDHLQVYEMLSSLRHEVGDARLTARTQRLLMLETLPEVQAFIESHRVFPLKRQTVVTCIDTLNKVS